MQNINSELSLEDSMAETAPHDSSGLISIWPSDGHDKLFLGVQSTFNQHSSLVTTSLQAAQSAGASGDNLAVEAYQQDPSTSPMLIDLHRSPIPTKHFHRTSQPTFFDETWQESIQNESMCFDEDLNVGQAYSTTNHVTSNKQHFTEAGGYSAHILTTDTETGCPILSEDTRGSLEEEEESAMRLASSPPRFRSRHDILSSSPMSSSPNIFPSSPLNSSQSSIASVQSPDADKVADLKGLTFYHEEARPSAAAAAAAETDMDQPSSVDQQGSEESECYEEQHGESVGQAQLPCSPIDSVPTLGTAATGNSLRDLDEADDAVSVLSIIAQKSTQTGTPTQGDRFEQDRQDTSLRPMTAAGSHDIINSNEESSAVTLQPEAHTTQVNHTEGRCIPAHSLVRGEGEVSHDIGLMSERNSVLGKRARSAQVGSVAQSVPSTKRPKVTLLREQERKLSTPFRTPTLKKSEPNVGQDCISPVTTPTSRDDKQLSLAQGLYTNTHSMSNLDLKEKHRTRRASLQFKSPLLNKIPSGSSAVRLTPTIQTMERKLQHLKRAVKIKQENDAEVLADLITKWSEAGREVAWEVWDLIKANVGQDSGSGGFKNSWGWAEEDSKVEPEVTNDTAHLRNGEDGDDSENQEKGQGTLGTMLHQLGIAHETFGWVEEEGVFRDE